MKEMRVRGSMLVGLGLALATSPAIAQLRSPQSTASSADGQDEDQSVPQQQQWQTPLDTNSSGRTARSSVGQVGQRQTRDTIEQQIRIKPMARIASRVQTRLRNRIDRYYDPLANATDPFVVAGDQARKGSRPR